MTTFDPGPVTFDPGPPDTIPPPYSPIHSKLDTQGFSTLNSKAKLVQILPFSDEVPEEVSENNTQIKTDDVSFTDIDDVSKIQDENQENLDDDSWFE